MYTIYNTTKLPGKMENSANTEEESVQKTSKITSSSFKELKRYHTLHQYVSNYKMSFSTDLHFVFGPVTTFSVKPSCNRR